MRATDSLRELGKDQLTSPGGIALLLAIIGTVVLAWVTTLVEPDLVTLAELPEREGQVIKIQGTLVETYETRAGGWILYVDDNSTTEPMQVYAPRLDFTPRTGDLIEAIGESQRYQGSWEVMCQNNGVRLLQPFESVELTAAELFEFPEKWTSLNVNLEITITDSRYDSSWGTVYFKVGDESHSVDVIIEAEMVQQLEDRGALPATLIEGETVLLRAQFEWDEYRMRYQFTLDSTEHGVWPQN